MNLSGILVVVPPADLDECVAALRVLPGVDVHYTDPPTGRIIVTQEAESVSAEVAGLRRIKALTKVILAELVYHYIEADTERVAEIPADLDELQGLQTSSVPACLTE